MSITHYIYFLNFFFFYYFIIYFHIRKYTMSVIDDVFFDMNGGLKKPSREGI